MGEPAKKLKAADEVVAPVVPDGSKPIDLVYFYATQPIGTSGNNMLVSAKHAPHNTGSSVNDGFGVSGLIQELTLYPSGFVVATVLGAEGVNYIVVTGGGNGKVAT